MLSLRIFPRGGQDLTWHFFPFILKSGETEAAPPLPLEEVGMGLLYGCICVSMRACVRVHTCVHLHRKSPALRRPYPCRARGRAWVWGQMVRWEQDTATHRVVMPEPQQAPARPFDS